VTTPIGHPDYQGFAQWRGPVVASGVQSTSIASPYTMAFYLTAYASLWLRVSGISASMQVTVNFFTDQSETVLAGSVAWTVIGGTELDVLIPALANYAQIVVTTVTAGAQTFTIAALPSNVPATHCTYPITGNYVAQIDVTVAASSAQSFVFPFIAEGDGQVMIWPDDNSGKLQVQVDELTISGAVQQHAIFTQLPTVAATQVFEFMANNSPMEVTIQNNDVAGPHSCKFLARILSR
jgi:hypothetical protein